MAPAQLVRPVRFVTVLPFAAAVFAGAFLLFQVQPLIGKFILPWFGGGPGVWSACLLFFQLGLLAGYAYAHWLSTYLRPGRQFAVHAIVWWRPWRVCDCALRGVEAQWHGKPEPGDSGALAVTVGMPYWCWPPRGRCFKPG